jgi:single-stranded DNA-binding protein
MKRDEGDTNIVVLSGTLAAPAELTRFSSGSAMIRLLLTVRAYEPRRRIDVVPVVLWDPNEELLHPPLVPGDLLWVSATVQRRFWNAPDGKQSRVEIVANSVCRNDLKHTVGRDDPIAGIA